MTPDQPSASFEREKWQKEVELRSRELDLKEREQANHDIESELKRREQAASQWRNPLVVAILAAAVAAGGNAIVAVVNGTLQRSLENTKAESVRILEMIRTGDPEKAARNLEFLLTAGLITDPELVKKLSTSLKARKPGGGPSLPAADGRISFEATESLTEPLRDNLQRLLEAFVSYLDRVGFSAATGGVRVKVERRADANAYYQDGTMVIDTRLSSDPSVVLREYSHHVLKDPTGNLDWQGQYGAIESALADYFACSFLNDPRMGPGAATVLGLDRPYFRLLANNRKFSEFQKMRNELGEMQFKGAEIWGGALWAIRDKLGRDTADYVVAAAWRRVTWPRHGQQASAFVRALLSAAGAKGEKEVGTVRGVLQDRQFPMGS